MKRYRILLAAVAMQMCLGATYAWSIFVLPLKQTTGILQGTAQLPFSLFYFAFTIVGIGLVAGIGVGFAYIVPIATCLRWFPRHKGLVTGVAVAGFGGGAALVSRAADTLMATVGMSPFSAFGVLGILFLLLVALAGNLMENPPESGAGTRQPIRVITVLKERSFAAFSFSMRRRQLKDGAASDRARYMAGCSRPISRRRPLPSLPGWPSIEWAASHPFYGGLAA